MRKFADPYIRSSALLGFSEAAGCSGADVEALLHAAGLPTEALVNLDMMVSFRRVASLFELASGRLTRPSFGLEWAQSMAPEFPNIGPVAYLAKFSRDLKEWLDLARRYWKYQSNAFNFELMPDPESDLMCLRYIAVPDAYPSRQLVEHAMATCCYLARAATERPNLNAEIIRFRHRRPADITLHQDVFQCPIEFDSLHDEIVVTKDIPQLPTRGSLKMFRSLLDVYMKTRAVGLPRPEQGMEYTVAMAITSLIGTQKCNIDETAALLGTSTKKLQRLLADEGTSFSVILEQVRENIARQLLLQSDMPISNITGLLDYSSASSFILAFKRWTGSTPLTYRKTERTRMEDNRDF